LAFIDLPFLAAHGSCGNDAQLRLADSESNAEAFTLLQKAGIIGKELSKSLRGMAGFRNIAVHQYEELDMDVMRWVLETGQRDWVKLGEALGVCIRP
jgi:uncharacterized protein YutE (UPF0331/DUF86 family)